jgi:hypothetical protein
MLSISANVSWPQVFSYLGILYLLGSHRWLKGSPSVPFPCFSHLFATHIMLVGWKSCSTDLNQVFAMQHNTLTPTIRWKFKNRSIVIFLVVLLNLDKKFRCLVIISCSQDLYHLIIICFDQWKGLCTVFWKFLCSGDVRCLVQNSWRNSQNVCHI